MTETRNPSGDVDISYTEVTKVFRVGLRRTKTAVSGVSFSVPRGSVVGLLGPNGSGKSTLLKMTLGFMRPTSGEILVCGHSPSERESRRFVGYLPENPRFQKFLTGREMLRYYGALLGLDGTEARSRAHEMLELVGLRDAALERIGGYSKGMVQRLATAQALLGRPRILLFDEPMSGLDPLGRMEIRRLIARIHAEMPSTTIFFSSHVLSDVEELCESVVLLSRGTLRKFCAIEDLLLPASEAYEITARGLDEKTLRRLGIAEGRTSPLGATWSVNGSDELSRTLVELRAAGARIVGIFSERRTLEKQLFENMGEPTAVPPARAEERTNP